MGQLREIESFHALVQKVDWILLLVLAIGFALRLWGINFGLPYMYHPDEGVPVGIALRILRTGNWNPQFFNWPSLSIYLNTLVYLGYYGVGRVLGWFASPADLPFPDVEIMAVGKVGMPEEFLLGRGLTVVFGSLSILLVYLICRQCTPNRLAASLGALLMAVDPVNVLNSHFIRPDTFAVFFALLSGLFALKIVTDPRPVNYVFAAVGLGLAASSKYNLALIVVMLLAAHWIQFRSRLFFRKEIYAAALVAAAVFFSTTPFAILDLSNFVAIGPAQDASLYAAGHAGAEGNTLSWYVTFLMSTLGWSLLPALGGLYSIIVRRDKKGLVLLSFPLVYFVFINLFTARFDTTILPIYPFLLILVALFLGWVMEWGARVKINSVVLQGAVIVLAVLLVFPPLQASAASDAHMLEVDGREQARQWIERNLPAGSRIALESYSPYVDRNKFVVSGFYGIQENSPDWYISNGYEYLVFSQNEYGRFFSDPLRYRIEVDRYNSLFSRFDQVIRFDDSGYQVLIYKTDVKLPSHRVAARFGDYGEHVELIGYDNVQWTQGGPLQVGLYWRTLDEKPEPYEVELRLLGQEDREIARTRGDLFHGKGWQTGTFDGTWLLSVPPEITPGQYRLQVNVIWMQYGYPMPAQSWTGQRIDPVILEPIELQARR